MAKQRDQITMSDDEVREFLLEQRSATMGTVGRDGAIHLIAMWYSVLDGEIWFETKAKSQKAVNLARDPRMSFLVEAGATYDKLRGVAIEGRGVLVDDADQLWRIGVDMFERYNAPYTDEMKPLVEAMIAKRVCVRLDVERTRTWDHRKLGLPDIELGGTTAASVGRP